MAQRLCNGKIRYKDELAAKIVLAKLVHKEHGERRVYGPCTACRGWHLTSKEQ